MSIPLDRLYNFLDSISGHNLIIYGWRPHGSKKLQDLLPWNPLPSDWYIKKTRPTLIFHDQEPLDYEFSQSSVEQEFYDAAKQWNDFEFSVSPVMQPFYKKLHLKSVVEINLYDLTLLVHSEKNSQQVKKYAQNNFVPVYYWCHAVIAKDWFRFAEHDAKLKHKSLTPKMFLIYNRAWSGTREYRQKFAELLITTDLYHDCITSFAEFDNQVSFKDHVFSNPELKPVRQDLEKMLPKNTHTSTASADYNNTDYQNSLIEVVLETLFDDTRNHLTEKTLRPIACGQPFILASTPGSLAYLRSYGFQTFDGFIDETYDTILDPVKRLNTIIREMQRINQLSSISKQQLLARMQEITKYNQQLFFSKEFHKKIINEFKQNLNQAMVKVKTGPKGNIWNQYKNTVLKRCPDVILEWPSDRMGQWDWAEKWLQSHIKS